MELKKMLPIIAMLLVVLTFGCKKDDEETGVRPLVTSTDPLNLATGITIDSKISAIFSVAMNPATITTTNFTLMKGTTPVAGAVAYSGKTATFTPTANLTPNTLYTATISAGVKDISGLSLAKNYTWTFTTSTSADLVLPTVTSTDPANSATGVTLNHLIVITFSEAMNPTTITALTVTLQHGVTAVTGAVTYTGTAATFTPASNLEPNTVYTGTVTTGAKDVAGNAMAAKFTFSFTTGDAPDTSLPMVYSTDPQNNAIEVARDKVIGLTFSEPMNPLTITTETFTLMQGTTPVVGTVAYAGTSATFTPTTILAAGTAYTATITTGAKDLAGNALAANTVWSFTTVVSPTVISTDPAIDAIDVALNKIVSATFSVPMDPATLTTATFTLYNGVNPVAGTVTYTGSTASFTPTADLLSNTVYTATITTEAKNELSTPLATNYAWSFKTVIVPPTVISTDPAFDAIDVALNKIVSATFSIPMDPSTITDATFTLNHGGTPVVGVVSYTGSTASFTPSFPLAQSTIYTATITTGAKNIQGTPLETGYSWSFTTTATAPTLAPVVLGAAGNYVILAKTAITNNPTSAITGDLALSPAAASAITGFGLVAAGDHATSPQVTGSVFSADMADPTPANLTTAVENMLTAYTDAAGRPDPDYLNHAGGNIGGLTLSPGLYKWTNTVTIPTAVTISGGVDDVWIFQIAQDLTVSSAVNITLTGGAQAKNIFWQVAGAVTIGTTSHFEGVILSMTSITFQTGTSFKGRALAQTAVVLDGNTVTLP